MSSERVLATSARPFLAYWPEPLEQSARRPSPRAAYEDSCAFVSRCGKRLGIEAAETVQVSVYERLGNSGLRVAEARRSAGARFGDPRITPEMASVPAPDVPAMWAWAVPRSRVEDVFAWLEEFADCAVDGPDGLDDAICASCGCAFWPRDLGSGRLLAGQRSDVAAPVFWASGITVRLQTDTTIALNLMLPFAAPTDDARRYLLELRTHLPVVLDPGYLYHFVPRPDRTKYERRPLASDWLEDQLSSRQAAG